MGTVDGKCWEWPAGRDWRGYGRTRDPKSRKIWRAHRMVWEMVNGPIPDGMEILHLCDNPPCVNPAHLQVGSHAENMRQAAERDRMADWRRHPNAKLSDDDVAAIRLRHLAGETQSELAQAFGVHGSYISRLVRSRRRSPESSGNRYLSDEEGRP